MRLLRRDSDRLTRYVTREGDAFAVYFARFSDKHPDSYVSVLVWFGNWSEDAPPSGRTAVAFRIWTHGDNYQVGVVDAEDDWDTNFLGTKLTRDQALESEWRQELFDLSNHIVECDRPIVHYLNSKAG